MAAGAPRIDIGRRDRQGANVSIVVTFYLALVAIGAFALWRAQAPERLVILLFVSAAILSTLSQPALGADAPRVLVGLLLIDVGVAVALAGVAIRFGRTWCIFAAALQIVSTLSHFGRLIDPTMDINVYAVMESASSYPQLLLLLIAIVRHPRARDRR